MITEPIVIPTDVHFTKRHEPTGALIGRRIVGIDDAREVSKAMPTPTTPVSAKRAPTLARTGGQQPKRALVTRTARLVEVSKAYRQSMADEFSNNQRARRLSDAMTLGTRGERAGRAVRAMPRAAAEGLAAGAIVGGSIYGAGRLKRYRTQKRRTAIGKAYRSFDPEDARQRRLGAYAAGSALSGGSLLYSGGRQVREDTRRMGEHVRGARESVEVDHSRRQLLRRIGEDLPDKRAALVRLRPGAKIAGGAALLATSSRLMSDRHKKPWR